ncbi:MAG: CBS domain-containing protein [Halobacteriales archaeon]
MTNDHGQTVADVMSRPLETVAADAPVVEAARHMREADVNGLFVPGATPGIVTTTDVVSLVADERDPSDLAVEDVMTSPVERVTTRMDLTEAAAMMTTYGIKHLPVVDEQGNYVGMLSSTDLAMEFA